MRRAAYSSRVSTGAYRHARPSISRCSQPFRCKMVITVMMVVYAGFRCALRS